jgi:N-acetylglutamate synthase
VAPWELWCYATIGSAGAGDGTWRVEGSSVTITRDRITAIERAAVAAWPASETANIDGWLWRCSGGGSQRANSVSPLAFHGRDIEAAISAVEKRYRERGVPPMFQVCDINEPADLDTRLQQRGYRLQEPCTTLAKPIAAETGGTIEADIEIAEAPNDGWLSVYVSGITPNRRGFAPAILARVPRPRAFFLLRHGGEPAATALGVVAEGVVVAECVMTHANLRRIGGASRIMRALETWGGQQGATIAALQAVTANTPAQALYAKLAYTRVGGYHYRVLDS